MRRSACTAAAVLAAVSVLAGCGGNVSPVRGGTLNMLGSGDVDYMDPNVSYYTTGYLALRMWSRQLLTYPAEPGRTTALAPDLATQVPSVSNGGISDGGLVYKLTIRTGVRWNTTVRRQVTATDVVRGVERTCNPVHPFGGLGDFESIVSGMASFCDAFAKVSPNVSAIEGFLLTHSISGVRVDRSNPLTVVFILNRPVTYFPYLLALPAFSPAPVEFLNYLPGSADLAQHTVSDGPYEIESYAPAKSILFVRNPAWSSSTDTVRMAYVDRIRVSETLTGSEIAQKLVANSPGADLGWDAPIAPGSVPALLSTNNRGLTLGPTYGVDPYILFNTASPNNGGALKNKAVRQALEYGISRSNLVRDDGGTDVAPPLTHVLPPGVVGSKPSDLYPYYPDRAKRILRAERAPKLHLTVLYQDSVGTQTNMVRTLESDLAKVGVTVAAVPASATDMYTKYLEVPAVARAGGWDLAFSQWVPDWYGDAAYSFFFPLLAGPASFPPEGSNFGLYNDPVTNRLIREAGDARTVAQAATFWAEADRQVMADAVIYPVTSPTDPVFHASRVHNTVFIPNLFQYDPTNVWLAPINRGG